MPTEQSSAERPGGSELRGEVVYLYAFDVANEIRLERAAELLGSQSQPFAARGDRPAPRDVPLARPLCVELPPLATQLRGSPLQLFVRVYEVGVISVILRVAVAGDTLAEFAPFHTPTLDDGRLLDALAREQCEEVQRRLADSLVSANSETEPEAYTVFCLTHLGKARDTNKWLAERSREVAGLLTETPCERLSESQVSEVLRLKRSFENTDLVVIDWDAALIVDLDGYAEDVLFVLELANLQLEEFRWMDSSLDRYLERAYVDLGRRRWWRFGYMGSVLETLRRLRVDLTKLADEVTHTTKFIGDWHLARVYVLARERFHLDQWRASVEQRLAELDRLYTLTRGDVYERRMLWLEVIIVIFFAIDLVVLFFKK